MKIVLKVEPVAKGRAKTAFANGNVWTFTPRKTEVAQETIVALVKEQRISPYPAHIPLRMEVVFYRCKSRWLHKKETMPFRKPDLDNFLKLLLDALNGIAFADDAQITTMVVKKRWTKSSQALSRKKVRTEVDKGYIMVTIREDKND